MPGATRVNKPPNDSDPFAPDVSDGIIVQDRILKIQKMKPGVHRNNVTSSFCCSKSFKKLEFICNWRMLEGLDLLKHLPHWSENSWSWVIRSMNTRHVDDDGDHHHHQLLTIIDH